MIVNKEKFSGVFVAFIGVYFLIYSLEYSIGSFSNMGPALFPMILSSLLLLLGCLMYIRGYVKEDSVEIKFKIPILLLSIILISGLIFKFLGAISASIFLILTSAMIHEKFKLTDTLKIIFLSLVALIILKVFLVKLLPL